MTKEEKIKEVYGDSFDKLKDFICTSSGVCSDRQYNKIDCPNPLDVGFTKDEVNHWFSREDNGEQMVDVFCWMPKSIEGLECNNGWFKIENRLPTEKVWVCSYTCNEQPIIQEANESIPEHYTHFQPFIVPKPPLFY